MFEESRSFEARNRAGRPAPVRRSEPALKAIAWSDLAARLAAARELREALRHDARGHIEDTAASFSDAAAKYFRELEVSPPDVNLTALGEHKGSAPIFPERKSDAAASNGANATLPRDDARDEQ